MLSSARRKSRGATPMIFSNCASSAAFTDHFSESSPAFMHSSTASGKDMEAFEVRNT